jgi:hypothetical protein
MVRIQAAPVQVVKAQNIHGQDLVIANAPVPGSLIMLIVKNLPDLGPQADLKRFIVISGLVEHTVVAAMPVSGSPGVYQVAVMLSGATPQGESVALAVSFDGKPAGTIAIPIR